MTASRTVIWRIGILTLVIGSVPTAAHLVALRDGVDTRAMLDASVTVRTLSHVRIDHMGDSVWESGTGSGFLASAERCEFWTNHHVVAEAAAIEIFPQGATFSGGLEARVVAVSEPEDFAVLATDGCEGIAEARLGSSSTLAAGDEVYAVGNPLGRNPGSITRGIVSHTRRQGAAAVPYLQTDAAINRGNSGGALFDRGGRAVGINTAIADPSGKGSIGIGYALPIDVARATARRLRAGTAAHSDAGIEKIAALRPAEAALFGVPEGRAAVVVTETPVDGPAAGRIFAHDAIHRIGAVDVVDAEQSRRVLSGHAPGTAVTLGIVRGGRPLEVELRLARTTPQPVGRGADYYAGLLGMDLEMWSEATPTHGGFDHPVITKVHSLGPAHRAHITSSQRSIAMSGPFVRAIQLDVKTVTGVVVAGFYHPVASIEQLEAHAVRAYRDDAPLLLEVRQWTRANPRDPDEALALTATAYFKVAPARTTAALADEFAAPGTVHAGVDAAMRAPGDRLAVN